MQNEFSSSDDAIFDEILKRSATDRAFRDLLVTDPAHAIEQVIGVPVSTLPRPINVKFLEKEAGLDAVIVLPDFMDAEGALSDAELEAVAGGICSFTCACSAACCITNMATGEEDSYSNTNA